MRPHVRLTLTTVVLLVALGRAPSARGDVFTAGPSGRYSTVQAAVTKALSVGKDNEVRIQGGIYAEHVLIAMHTGQLLRVSGGWDKTFLALDSTRQSTLDGRNTGRSLTIKAAGGELFLEHLALVGGLANEGGGFAADLLNAHLDMRNSTARNNQAFDIGGGGLIQLEGAAQAVLSKIGFRENLVNGFDSAGGGLAVLDAPASAGNSVSIQFCSFDGNTLQTDGTHSSAGGGLLVEVGGTSIQVLDSSFSGNLHRRTGASLGTGLALWGGRGARIEARRLSVSQQRALFTGANDNQVDLRAGDAASLVFSDSKVVQSNMRGVVAFSNQHAILRLINLTVAYNDRGGLWVDNLEAGHDETAAYASVDNSILWSNRGAPRLGAFVLRHRNLSTADPRFLDLNTFQLRADSPAKDAGLRSLGVGSLDLNRRPRVVGRNVDAGAYELQ